MYFQEENMGLDTTFYPRYHPYRCPFLSSEAFNKSPSNSHHYPCPSIRRRLTLSRRSAETDTGMSRLTLSDADKQARDWFVDTTRSLGCKVTIDAMGNTFAIRPGRQPGPPTCAGSHLDTQPMGGRYVRSSILLLFPPPSKLPSSNTTKLTTPRTAYSASAPASNSSASSTPTKSKPTTQSAS